METLPERQDPIKSLLSWFMSDEDVARYSDVECALETLKTDELCWQAAVSIGVHALGWGVIGKTDEEKALADNLADRALEPSEALHESLTRQAGQQPLTDEQGRMLFHVRFGLGFLLWVKGDHERAKRALHHMVATKLSRYGGRWAVRSGGDILTYTDDMARGKELTALVMSNLYAEVEDYEEALFLIKEAADAPWERFDPLDLAVYLLHRAAELVDRWAAKCERVEQEEASGRVDADPWCEWMTLLYGVGGILSVCSHADTSGAPPGQCDKASAQFFAYKFGELAARSAARMTADWPANMSEWLEDEVALGGEHYLLHALLCEYAICSDWQKARETYVTWWELTPCYEGTPTEEIGPHTDLYWAMRIGFAEKMLESTGALVPADQLAAPPNLVRDIETIKEVVRATAIRLVKERHDREQRLPPTKEAIEQCLREPLGDLWDKLPSDVADPLLHAEFGHRFGWQSGIGTRALVLDFHEAAEACFACYFAEPFATYLNTYGVPSAKVCRGVWHRQPQLETFHAHDPRCLTLGQWAGVLEVVAGDDVSDGEDWRVRTFLKEKWPDLAGDALRQLAGSLRNVQHYRNRAAHGHSPPRSHHTERSELDEMRDLVLGSAGSPSMIAQIYRLLAPGKQP